MECSKTSSSEREGINKSTPKQIKYNREAHIFVTNLIPHRAESHDSGWGHVEAVEWLLLYSDWY